MTFRFKPAAPKTSDSTPVPPTPTPRWVLAVLIVLLLGLVGATVKLGLYPDPPKGWASLYQRANLPMEEVNRILTESGARIAPVKLKPEGGTETWELPNRIGMWTIELTLKKTPEGLVYGGDEMRYEVSHLPGVTRRWKNGVRE